jgi:methyl-accepting chemotaxis protein
MFGNMKLGHKILTGFLIIIAGTAFIGVFSAVNMVAAAGRFTVPVIVILVCAAAEAVFGIIAANRIGAGITGPMNMIIEKIKMGGEQVVSASSQLSATSQQLADANVEQASSLEEISSTMEETSSMIEQNSENTRQADLLAEQAKSTSDLCNTDMREMIDSMNEIKKSSDN